MQQVSVLIDSMPPIEALQGKDSKICGDCPLRPSKQGGCYVTVARFAQAVWRSVKGLDVVTTWATTKPIRLGAYGDPAMLPEKVIRRRVSVANKFRPNHTGFTQRWRLKSNQWLRFFCMASVSTPADAARAQSMGWRTYRARSKDEPIMAGEVTCPASKEAGNRTTCQQCVLCDGMRSDTDRRKNITILYH